MPERHKRILQSGFPGLQFFAYATLSCFNPFVTLILTDRGLDNTHIGLVLTANSLAAIIAQPFWGMVSDRIGSIRKVFIICFISAGLLFLLMPLVHTLSLLIVIFPLILFFNSPIVPLMDTWTYQAMKDQPDKSYGAVRYWGSVGYAIVLVLIGRIVTLTSIHVTSAGYAILAAVSILISLNLPPQPHTDRLSLISQPAGRPGLGLLLKNYHFVSFVLVLGLLNIAVQPMFGFLPRLMLAVGGSQEMYGWLMALSAIVEIPFFLVSRHLLARFRPVRLLIFAMFCFVVRIYLYAVAAGPAALILISLLHGCSYAAYLTGTISYIDELAPAGLKSTALTMASAVYGGVSGMIGNALAGKMMDAMTIQPVYRIGAWIVLGVLGFFILTLVMGRFVKPKTRESLDAPAISRK